MRQGSRFWDFLRDNNEDRFDGRGQEHKSLQVSKVNLQKEKRDNFQRLAGPRTEKAVKALQLVGNLSNTGRYNYSDTEVDHILGSLQSELTFLQEQFKRASARINKQSRRSIKARGV